jgi:hypothetical protein
MTERRPFSLVSEKKYGAGKKGKKVIMTPSVNRYNDLVKSI